MTRRLKSTGTTRRAWQFVVACALLCTLAPALAALGQTQIAPTGIDGPVTVYYPSNDEERIVPRGKMQLSLAVDGAPAPGNGRLIVISHGSGGSPWVHADLARALVQAGFVVAMPEHRGDNYKDPAHPGPDSWALRPAEVSRAIDAAGRDPRFGPQLRLDKVGVYGMSAGGHTALSLAGGRWSAARFKRHCDADLAQDFYACVGLYAHLTGGPLDGLKKWFARLVIDHRFDDETLHADSDARVAAVAAGVPAAADFDPDSLAAPRVPLALITAGQDRWLVPRFHGDRILQACKTCEHLAELPTAGHGALLSPLPAGLTGTVGELLNDPPGYDRDAATAMVNSRLTGFFLLHLQP